MYCIALYSIVLCLDVSHSICNGVHINIHYIGPVKIENLLTRRLSTCNSLYNLHFMQIFDILVSPPHFAHFGHFERFVYWRQINDLVMTHTIVYNLLETTERETNQIDSIRLKLTLKPQHLIYKLIVNSFIRN